MLAGLKWTDSVKGRLGFLLGTEATEKIQERKFVVKIRTGTEATENLWTGS